MGLLKTILYLLVFYYAFKFLARLLAQKKAEQQFGGQQDKGYVKEGNNY